MPTNAEFNRHMQEQKDKKAVAEAVKTLTDVVNHSSSDFLAQALYEGMIRQHRTLQQDTFRALYLMMKKYAEEANTDLRNEDSKDFCKQVAALDTYFSRV